MEAALVANEEDLLEAAISTASALVYGYVATVTARRKIGGEAELASSLFTVWWWTLAAVTAVGALRGVLAYGGILDLGLHLTILHTLIVAIVGAVWALQYYLFYLFTGDRRWFAPISAYYAILYVWILYTILWRQATGVVIVDGRLDWSYARDVSDGLRVAQGIAFFAPTLIGAIGYARLYFRVEGTTQRYRIALVSMTILVWFSASLVALGFGFNDDRWWQQLSRFFGLAASLLILAAYRPPAFVRRRWGIEPVGERSDRSA